MSKKKKEVQEVKVINVLPTHHDKKKKKKKKKFKRRKMAKSWRNMASAFENAILSPNLFGPFRVPSGYNGARTMLGQAAVTYLSNLADTSRVGIAAMQSYYLTNTSGTEMALAVGSVATSSTVFSAANMKNFDSTTNNASGSFNTMSWGVVYPGISKINDMRQTSACIEIMYEGDTTKATGTVTVTHVLSEHCPSYATLATYLGDRSVTYDNLLLNAYSTTFPTSKLLNGPITVPAYPISPKAFEYGTNAPAAASHSDAQLYDWMMPIIFLTGCDQKVRFTLIRNMEYVPELGTDQTPFAQAPPGIEHSERIKNAFQEAINELPASPGLAHYTNAVAGATRNAMTTLWAEAGDQLLERGARVAGNAMAGFLGA
jgi:hypothetical protein